MLRPGFERPFPDAERLAIDLETTGLSPLDDDIVCLAVSDGVDGVVFDLRLRDYDVAYRELVAEWIEEQIFDRKLTLHNAQFDLAFLREKYAVGYPTDIWDTMLAEQLTTAGLDHSASLKETALRRLGVTLDKELQTSFTLEGDLTDAQVEYALHDVVFLNRLAERQRADLVEKRLGLVWSVEQKALPVFTEMVRRGIWVDQERLTALFDEETTRRDLLAAELQTRLTPHVVWKRIEKLDAMQDELDAWLAALQQETARLEQEWHELEWEDEKILDPTLDKKDGKPKGQKRYVKAQLKRWRETNPRPPAPKMDESPINLNSQQQVLAAFSDLGIDVPDLQKKTLQAKVVEADPLIRDEILRPYLDYKKAEKLCQFREQLFAAIGCDGRLRASCRQIGTATGRPVMLQPNLLQMPSDPRFRSAFRAERGKLFVVADFSQMELRILAQSSGDPTMIAAFKAGEDLHTKTAALMFGVEMDAVTEKQRKIAKTLNFGICYGMGPAKLAWTLAAEGIFMTYIEAKAAIEQWKRTFPRAAKWLTRMQDHALQYGWTAEPLGRRRFFDLTTEDEGEKASIARQGANFCIQGANATVTKVAQALIAEFLGDRGLVVLQVYDEIVVEIDEEVALAALDIVRTAMEDAAAMILTDVPVKVDAVISPSWNEKEAIACAA